MHNNNNNKSKGTRSNSTPPRFLHQKALNKQLKKYQQQQQMAAAAAIPVAYSIPVPPIYTQMHVNLNLNSPVSAAFIPSPVSSGDSFGISGGSGSENEIENEIADQLQSQSPTVLYPNFNTNIITNITNIPVQKTDVNLSLSPHLRINAQNYDQLELKNARIIPVETCMNFYLTNSIYGI